MKFDVVDASRKPVEQIELDDAVFAVEVKPHLLHEVVRAQLAGARAGTASTKHRGEVNGSTIKLYRQKGTGRARSGNIRTNVRKGGPAQFGPKPRDFGLKVNKKVKAAALCSALSLKASESKLLVVKELKLAEPKTKAFVALMSRLGLNEALVVTSAQDDNLTLGARNVSQFKVLHVDGLNVYDLLDYSNLVITAEAIEVVQGRCRK